VELQALVTRAAKVESQSCKPLMSELQRADGRARQTSSPVMAVAEGGATMARCYVQPTGIQRFCRRCCKSGASVLLARTVMLSARAGVLPVSAHVLPARDAMLLARGGCATGSGGRGLGASLPRARGWRCTDSSFVCFYFFYMRGSIEPA
jgi:hypothetical protein